MKKVEQILKNLLTKFAKIKKITKFTAFLILLLAICVETGSPYPHGDKTHIGAIYLKHKREVELREFNLKLRSEKPDLFVLAVRESAFRDTFPNYKVHNEFGYIGAWQIHVSYLPSLGIHGVTLESFIKNPDEVFPFELQLQAIETLIEKNISYLGWYYDYYPGKRARGVRITEEGMIYAAHLGGAWGLKKFLLYGKNPTDAYGTSIKDYLDYKNTFWYKIN